MQADVGEDENAALRRQLASRDEDMEKLQLTSHILTNLHGRRWRQGRALLLHVECCGKKSEPKVLLGMGRV